MHLTTPSFLPLPPLHLPAPLLLPPLHLRPHHHLPPPAHPHHSHSPARLPAAHPNPPSVLLSQCGPRDPPWAAGPHCPFRSRSSTKPRPATGWRSPRAVSSRRPLHPQCGSSNRSSPGAGS